MQASNPAPTAQGSFVISLDFELMWGVRDIASKKTYGSNILGVHKALPLLLEVFKKNKIRASFASVGFLFCKDKKEIFEHIPVHTPTYERNILSPYGDYLIKELGEGYADDQYHYGMPLIEMIRDTEGQEVSSHTFSHYYCLEHGQNAQQFREDIEAAINIARKRNIQIKSIVFPRNQVNEKYIGICEEYGINSYRLNENSWLYKVRIEEEETRLRRIFRLIDAYINISGHNCFSEDFVAAKTPFRIPSSRFLRPWSKKLSMLDGLRLARIKNSMTYAAKNQLVYHLWWHPHNFGINQEENFSFLQKIIDHYLFLNQKYGFTSMNMNDLAQKVSEKYGQ